MNIFKIWGLLKQIEEPPSLDNENAFRDWAENTADVVMEIALLSGDDEGLIAAKMLRAMVLDPTLWTRFYSLLKEARKHVD